MNRQDAKDAKTDRTIEPPRDLDVLVHAVIGAALEVHRLLGPGFLESLYEEALSLELALRGVPFRRQAPIAVEYKGRPIGQARLDLLVSDPLIVELKAVETISAVHLAQILSYLKASRLQLGLVINFNVPELRRGIRRVIRSC